MENHELDQGLDLQSGDSAERGRQLRTTLAYYGGLCLAIIVTAVVIMRAFSPEPESVVSEYLDATITGENGYEYFDAWDHGAEQIFGKVVRGYEVKNVIGDVVSVDITFASTAGSDIHQTLRFTVTRGKIRVI